MSNDTVVLDSEIARGARSDAWLRCSTLPVGARARLFCIPYAGGSAATFRNWSAFPSQDVTICRVQLPGREHRLAEPPFDSLALLVRTLAEILRPHLNVPFAFFGHSMGALIAFELARELRRRYAINPIHLFVSAHRAPQLPNRHPPLHGLPDHLLVDELIRLNAASADALRHAELRPLVLPLMRADLSLCERYAYEHQAPLDCPISAFAGSEDARVTVAELAAWRAQTNATFKLRTVFGDHFFLHKAETLLQLAISADLAASMSN